MDFKCPNCSLSGNVEDSKIPPEGTFATCPKCKTKFQIKKETESTKNAPEGIKWKPSNIPVQEIVVFEGNPEWIAYIIWFIGAIIFACTLVLIPVSIALFIGVIIERIRCHFKVTNQRIVVTHGIVSKRTTEIDISDIRSINVTQGPLQRMLGLGRLEFATASGPLKEAQLYNIRDPELLKEKIRSFKAQ